MKFFMMITIATVCIMSILGCEFEGCDHVDMGSCGTACCRLSIFIDGETSTEVMNKLNSSLVLGGPDKLYIPMMTAEGTLTFGDLRPFDKPVDFIGQAWHTTANLVYNDTVNILLTSTDAGTDVYAFSISQIAGAYSDEGQNYFNIVQLFDSVKWNAGSYKLSQYDDSCPPPSNKK
mmetsp:Transcript_356/g.653  ORF Transcript_356/g.653 Transcript_356/m.653 type:complete len:176 (-) Transcript_356:161-688(-)|eukprot:CAMPEP_0185024666 /NCGR_PEP_ID=MMETSP1103-20130426/7839_1 /TAXON_ID=36769 /ORGANISM="Paraphysomonas bandaiensis, Strain Caron Lab Isolate" /LENGTH=175 /DNA_ID=CAMNT_0027557695 /DNA_START=58 /DNA_END=585 /DNA_ORIENTATION=+